jgi:hypothetical protein
MLCFTHQQGHLQGSSNLLLSYYWICVLVLCMCTTVYLSLFCYICVLKPLLILCSPADEKGHFQLARVGLVTPHYHTTIICVRILLYLCPHTAIYLASSYYCISSGLTLLGGVREVAVEERRLALREIASCVLQLCCRLLRLLALLLVFVFFLAFFLACVLMWQFHGHARSTMGSQ